MSTQILSLNRRNFLSGAAAAGAFVMLHPFSARAQANQAHLRIMETTDLHVHICGPCQTDYCNICPEACRAACAESCLSARTDTLLYIAKAV